MNKKIMIIAGEASGDLHGAELIQQLKKIDPGIEFYGVGGDRMIAAGLRPLVHINRMAFLGVTEIIRHLPFIRKVRNQLIDTVKKYKIQNAVLIDYPGFNLRIAHKFKKTGLEEFLLYLASSVGVGQKRIRKIKKIIDKMIVVFPFEEKLYKDNNIDVSFVGHPLIEKVENYKFMPKEEFFNKFRLDTNKEILVLLPGSRRHEIEKIFPAILPAAEKIANDNNLQIVVACADNIDASIYGNSDNSNFKIIKGHTYELFRYSRFGIVKSGTSTLEAALLGLPFVVVYSTNIITYLLGRIFVRLDHIAMPNILLGETVVEELIQKDLNEEKIIEVADGILNNPEKYKEIKNKLSKIKSMLGNAGASRKAAEIIYSQLNEA
ncbi:lipid-A-disaccharide synthase [Melioribacter roseus P3M-2]|uniref:Lipid-A-disaccharide synthase n=1 Tax=Melioribacter roseus (strain DSM 23840 / JCM 17771 / VKM B-2668 / P3M-2) TaxID=1191523 RepID=I7A5B0_MELRP|nr:lipid-A-disaccharide synthase [Melioribacter roseus]AFN75071.1 lipid-A-disaccharide synthase [Melioribacter roseus P3M-2]